MQVAQFGVKPLANHRIAPSNYSSNKRVRTDSTPSTLRKLKSPPQVFPIRACELGIHRTD